MKNGFISTIMSLLLMVGSGISSIAQFEIGHTSIPFYDSARDRDVPVEIYYPADGAGDDVPVSSGVFPVIVFGHGFFMPWSDYQNIWDFLVPEGYVMAFCTTEGGLAPDHENYGLDLSFIMDAMMAESLDGESIFFNHLSDRQAIMGHSMGGGASWLAASENTDIETVIGLAPAETNPSAIDAAASVSVPALIFSGSSDAVTPPADHHLPIYENTASGCKAFVNIIDGGHCGYADDGTLCDIGEFGFSGMSREEQQQITHELLLYWLGYYLKNQEDADNAFESYFEEHENVELTTTCIFNGSDGYSARNDLLFVYPNPANNFIQFNASSGDNWELTDSQGRILKSGVAVEGINRIDIHVYSPGLYRIHRIHSGTILTSAFGVIH